MKNHFSLDQLIADKKIRKGPSSGFTEYGRYWNLSKSVRLCNDASEFQETSLPYTVNNFDLIVRHFESGKIQYLIKVTNKNSEAINFIIDERIGNITNVFDLVIFFRNYFIEKVPVLAEPCVTNVYTFGDYLCMIEELPGPDE